MHKRVGRKRHMYLVKRSPYPFIQVYPFIKDLRVGGTKVEKRKHIALCWLLFQRILQTFFPDSVLMHDQAHLYDDQWETISTIWFSRNKNRINVTPYVFTNLFNNSGYFGYMLFFIASIRRNKVCTAYFQKRLVRTYNTQRKTSQGKPCFHYRDGFAVCTATENFEILT